MATIPTRIRWELLSAIGEATLKEIAWPISNGSTLTQCANAIGITPSSARMLLAELRVELSDEPPSGNDLRILARRQ